MCISARCFCMWRDVSRGQKKTRISQKSCRKSGCGVCMCIIGCICCMPTLRQRFFFFCCSNLFQTHFARSLYRKKNLFVVVVFNAKMWRDIKWLPVSLLCLDTFYAQRGCGVWVLGVWVCVCGCVLVYMCLDDCGGYFVLSQTPWALQGTQTQHISSFHIGYANHGGLRFPRPFSFCVYVCVCIVVIVHAK